MNIRKICNLLQIKILYIINILIFRIKSYIEYKEN